MSRAGLFAATLLSIATLGSAFAQEAATPAPAPEGTTDLVLELNALQPSENGCRISFLATNNLGKDLEKAAFEVALFNAAGAIERLVALDFKTLTSGKTKVLQFNLAETQCDNVGRVLVNDVAACTGEGIEPGACLAGLKTQTKTDITFGL